MHIWKTHDSLVYIEVFYNGRIQFFWDHREPLYIKLPEIQKSWTSPPSALSSQMTIDSRRTQKKKTLCWISRKLNTVFLDISEGLHEVNFNSPIQKWCTSSICTDVYIRNVKENKTANWLA